MYQTGFVVQKVDSSGKLKLRWVVNRAATPSAAYSLSRALRDMIPGLWKEVREHHRRTGGGFCFGKLLLRQKLYDYVVSGRFGLRLYHALLPRTSVHVNL